MTSLTNGYAACGLVSPVYHTRPPCHPFNPDGDGLVEGSYAVLALPLPKGRLGQMGAYPRGANGWRQFDPCSPLFDKFALSLHLFSFAMELNDNNGTPVFLGTPGSAKVRQSQLAFIRRICNRHRSGDEDLLRVGVDIRWDHSCDKNLSEVFSDIHRGTYDNRIPGRQDLQHGDGDEIADGVRYDLPDEDGENDHRGGRRRRRGGRRGGRGRGRGGGDDDDEDGDDDESDNEDDIEDSAILAILSEALKDARGRSTEGKNIIEKVKIIVQHFTRPDPMFADREEDAGCIIFFCVMDELYSMGTPFRTLIKMGVEHRLFTSRQRKAQNGKRGQNGGGGRPPWMQNEPSLTELFPFLKDVDHVNNGLLNFTPAVYVDLAAFIYNDKEVVLKHMRENEHRIDRLNEPGTREEPNIMHPVFLFTAEWAFNTMQLYGVAPQQASMSTLKGSANWIDERERGLMMGTYVDCCYFDPRRSYHYLMAGFVWARLGHAGMHDQYFPWFDVPDPLKQSSMMRSANNAMVRFERADGATKMAPDYMEAMMIESLGRPEVLPLKFTDPNAIMRKNGIRQVTLDNVRMMNTLCAPADPAKEPKAWRLFTDMLASYREACLCNMMNVLKPSNHIYPSMNVILLWMSSEMRRASVPLAYFTTDPYCLKPDTWPLDGFANYMIGMGLRLKNDLFLAGRADRWILTHHAAQDCHATLDVKMHPSAIVHGVAETGKSHLFNSALRDACIEGTVTPILESSEKAWYVHDDSIGLIIFKDEVEKIWVDAKAAEKDTSGAAERLKSMTTDHMATYRCLVLIEGANGRSERRSEDIQSMFHATIWCCTNKVVGHGDDAIASRFFNFVMTPAECNLFEFASLKERLNDDDRIRKADAVHAWRVKQALLAISLVLIDSRILPNPSMDVFDNLHTRVLAYFQSQGVNTNAIRKVDMVKRVAVIYTVLYGIICLYDNPGAKYAGKEFEMQQLLDLIPYLYCTKQIAMFTMTQTEEVFLNPLRSLVLRGIMTLAKLPYARGKTIEEYFREDTTRALQDVWRRESNGTSGVFVDFNYIQLNGAEMKDIYANIAECCDVAVGPNEVEGVLRSLGSGGKAGFIQVKRVKHMQEAFYTDMQGESIMRFAGLARETETSSLQIVRNDFKNRTIAIATEAINKLHDDLLTEAFQNCLYSKWQPQEILTAYEVRKQHPVKGDKDHTYVGLFDVLRITPEVVAEFSFTDAYSAPNSAYITPLTEKMLAGPRLHPDKRAESYAPSREKRQSSTLNIEDDLDVWGHKQHFYRAGCTGKFKDSVGHPATIRETVRLHLQLNEDRHAFNEVQGRSEEDKHKNLMPRCLKLRYPNDLVDELDTHIVRESQARPFEDMATYKQRIYDMDVDDWKKGGKQGPMPVMQTLCSMARAVHTDYPSADASMRLGYFNRNNNHNNAQDVPNRRMGRLENAPRHTLLHAQTPREAMPANTAPYKKQSAELRSMEDYIQGRKKNMTTLRRVDVDLNNNNGDDLGGDNSRPTQRTRRSSQDEQEDDSAAVLAALPDISSLVPSSESRPPRRMTAVSSAATLVHQPASLLSAVYTMDGNRVVLKDPPPAKIRAKPGPVTSSSSASSSPILGPSVGGAGPARPSASKKARKEADSDHGRSVLERSVSMGFNSLSAQGSGDGDDSLSHQLGRYAVDGSGAGGKKAGVPPSRLLDDYGDDALEPMDFDGAL